MFGLIIEELVRKCLLSVFLCKHHCVWRSHPLLNSEQVHRLVTYFFGLTYTGYVVLSVVSYTTLCHVLKYFYMKRYFAHNIWYFVQNFTSLTEMFP